MEVSKVVGYILIRRGVELQRIVLIQMVWCLYWVFDLTYLTPPVILKHVRLV
jgi:hypothetical protein